MRSIRNAIQNSYAASRSMAVRLVLYWFIMALLLVAAILSILMATGVLRELYREETCGGWAYAQAAEDTEDVCLRDIFRRFSQAEYGHAASLLHLLESSLTTGNNLLK